MYRTVMKVCDLPENSAAWQSFAPFVISYNDVTTKVAGAEVLAQPQHTEPATLTKKQERGHLESIAYAFSSIIHAYAVRANNPGLANKVKFTRTDLRKASDVKFIGHLRQIIKVAYDEEANLTGHQITTERIAAFDTAREKFELLATGPRLAQAARKTDTARLDAAVKEIDKIFKNELDRLMEHFRLSHPKFYGDYKNARQVVVARATRGSTTVVPVAPASPVH